MTLYDSKYPPEEGEWFQEPQWAVELLVEAEPFEGLIYDPACGSGTIPKVFAGRNHQVQGTDLYNRGYGLSGINFLTDSVVAASRYDNIVTNPPYGHARYAELFIRHALPLVRQKAAFFLPLSYLAGQRRHKLFSEWKPARVYILSNRPSCPPGRLLELGEIEAKGGKPDYCWIVWSNTEPNTHTEMKWLLKT